MTTGSVVRPVLAAPSTPGLLLSPPAPSFSEGFSGNMSGADKLKHETQSGTEPLQLDQASLTHIYCARRKIRPRHPTGHGMSRVKRPQSCIR